MSSVPDSIQEKSFTTISFSGSGFDPETGSLPSSAMTWEVTFHHDVHTHPAVAPFTGAGGSYTVPDVGHTEANVWYRIHLTVRDPAGLAHHVYRDVVPVTMNLTVATNVPGLSLTLDDQPVTAPDTVAAVAGLS